jgi:hypothetical protein
VIIEHTARDGEARADPKLGLLLALLYGPAARCKPKVMIWRTTEPLCSWPSAKYCQSGTGAGRADQ